jgi:hypothetical protein
VALFSKGDPCALCGAPMQGDALIGFTYVASRHPLVQMIDDCVVHQSCLEEFPRRSELIAAWNEEAASRLGQQWMLKLTRDGRVTRISRWDWMLYRWGLRGRLARVAPRKQRR